MRKRQKSIVDKSESTKTFLAKTAAIVKIIRIELLIASIGLILSLGQYFQNSINVRINITTTWRQGYTSENRTIVNTFISLSRKWKEDCNNRVDNDPTQCKKTYEDAIKALTSNKELYSYSKDNKSIGNNLFIQRLASYNVSESPEENKSTCQKIAEVCSSEPDKKNCERITNKFCGETTDSTCQNITDENCKEVRNNEKKYFEIIYKYRNAIIETLNTLESVKAVIESKPLPFRITIFYRDTLEGRYRDIIKELKGDLDDFIVAYRASRPERDTPAWFVLTSEESYLNDLVNVTLYFLIFITSLYTVYIIKKRIYSAGYLNDV